MNLSESSVLYRNKEEIEYEISELNDMISEFNQVSNILDKLPDKVQHEIIVPLGPLAFSQGYIINTNKVLMLLGTDLYIERTAKESLGTINRRRLQAEECLRTLTKNLDKIKESLKIGETETEILNSENKKNGIVFKDGFAEIREEIDENEELVPPPLSNFEESRGGISSTSDFNSDKLSLNKEDDSIDYVSSGISNIKISTNDHGKERYERGVSETKRNISLFKQRMSEKK